MEVDTFLFCRMYEVLKAASDELDIVAPNSEVLDMVDKVTDEILSRHYWDIVYHLRGDK